MLIQNQVGSLPSSRQTAGTPNNPGGTFGEAFVTELAPQYYSLVKANRVFTISASGVNGTGFTGGAAGTPLLGIYNPATSGTDLVLLQARVGVRTTGSAAVSFDFNFFMANQTTAAVTGTQTASRSMYSQQNTGSVSYAMVNTTNTGALASTLIAPSISIGTTAASAAQTVGAFIDDIKGAIIVAPGNYLAYGIAATTTSASFDVALIWAEIPA